MIAAGHQVIACAPDDDPEVRSELAAWGADFHRIPMKRTGINPLEDARTLLALVTAVPRGSARHHPRLYAKADHLCRARASPGRPGALLRDGDRARLRLFGHQGRGSGCAGS